MGKYIRHLIGAFVGAVLGTITAQLALMGYTPDPVQMSALAESLTTALTLFVTLGGYAVTEKFLKRFPSIDYEGWISRLELKRAANLREGIRPPLG